MSEFSFAPANFQPNTAERTDYPLNIRPEDLQFGDIIKLPPDSDRPEGSSLIVEGWQKDKDGMINADGVLISDHCSPGSTEYLGGPSSVTVLGHMTVDEISDRVHSVGFMQSVDKSKLKSRIQEMQIEFDVVHGKGS
jgi:hypothetical protein